MKLTTIELRQINCQKVYDFIYERRVVSKQMIADELKMSIPTIAQDLNYLSEKNLICEDGFAKSTGGRPPVLFRCNENAKVPIGVEVMFDRLNVYAVNIVGNVLKSMTRMISFIAEDAYYRAVGQTVSTFVSELDVEEDSILGVGVAIQGIISFDGERLVYSGILNNSDITREDFARYLKWPCYLFHDSDSAGYAESRYDKNIAKAAYIYLNPYFGSTMILDGKVIQDEDISSGIFAHMCLYPGGKQCYCGKKGCVDAYCSAKALERESGEETEVFFEKLRKDGKHEKAVWKKYLQNLAIVINNIRMVINCDFVIGGKLERYMIDEDYERIKEYARNANAFNSAGFQIKQGHYGDTAAPIGAALILIDKYLGNV